MFFITRSSSIYGVTGFIVNVEIDVSNGLPGLDIVGLPDTAVKEARERVRAAIKNSDFDFPQKRVTINLAPADIKKEGSVFDLAIAAGILAASMQITTDLSEYVFLGELSLDGTVHGVKGVLPMCIELSKKGWRKVIVSAENADEAALVKDIGVYPVHTLKEMCAFLNGNLEICPHQYTHQTQKHGKLSDYDFKYIKGQEKAKRALEIAAAGAHNVLMAGVPGAGKTLLAKSLATILPDMSFEECLEVTKIYSIAGLLKDQQTLITERPFRAPHHTISAVSLVGGGRIPHPGEVSLSHFGVLFLDELTEFSKHTLEVLRQPLEDEEVTITRVNGTVTFPSKFILILASNLCPCGYYGDDSNRCTCTAAQIKAYQSKISGPLLDRVDLNVDMQPVNFEEMIEKHEGETSERIKKRIEKARQIQLERYREEGIFFNSQLKSKHINQYCAIGTKEQTLLKAAFHKYKLSARAYTRILKVARTIADLEGAEQICTTHLAEAIQHRSVDRKLL